MTASAPPASVTVPGPSAPASDAVVHLWRIASDTPDYTADDTTGAGARATGGRWNRARSPVLYTSTSRALACLETVVHLRDGGLPLNRYLVEVTVPAAAWPDRESFDPDAHVGWDAQPAGRVSLDWGTNWIASGRTLLAEVPSAIVAEESNILINPVHAGMAGVTIRKVRRWLYDARLFGAPTAPRKRRGR